MKFAIFHRLAAFLVVLVLSWGAFAAGGDAEWQHSHGHGGGGVTAIGKPGDSSKVSRTVTLEVGDGLPFTPPTITVKRGETIRFIVKNSGNVKHEMVLGTESQLRELYHTRMQAPEKELVSPSGITVDAGKSGEIIWEFTKFGTVSFACLLPGHFDAGERGTVIVQ
jgi:uncharacterized cupredoxin-like copper-binding protein